MWRSKSLHYLWLPLFVFLLVLIACKKSSRFQASGVGLTSTGMAIGTNTSIVANGTQFVFPVYEAEQNNQSLNTALNPGQSGDTDSSDRVLFLYDIETQFASNIRMAVSSAGNILFINNLIIFTVDEAAQGASDLNGDGVADDHVIHFFNVENGSLINTGLAVLAGTLVGDGDVLAYELPSGTVGWMRISSPSSPFDTAVTLVASPVPGQDLQVANGFVAFLNSSKIPYALDTLSASNAVALGGGLAAIQGSLHLFKGLAFYLQAEGAASRNGDADTTDYFPAVTNMATEILGGSATSNISEESKTTGFSFQGNLFGFLRDESESGTTGTDHNGDGDTDDEVLFWMELTNPILVHNTFFACKELKVFGSTIAATVLEAAQENAVGAPEGDLNGDGDVGLDRVVVVFSVSNGSATSQVIGLDAENLQLSSQLLSFGVNEVLQGEDLNGDGFISGSSVIAHVVRLDNSASMNLGWQADNIMVKDNRCFFRVGESQFGVGDINGDGDASDAILGVFTKGNAGGELFAATPIKSGFFGVAQTADLFIFPHDELDELRDQNGDFDQVDRIVDFFKF